MVTANYLPSGDQDKDPWLANFAIKFEKYAPEVGFGLDVVQKVQTFSKQFSLMMHGLEMHRNYGTTLTAYKNLLRDGAKGELAPLSEAPATLAFEGVVEGNIFGQIVVWVDVIKEHKNYNESMGKDMGIEAPIPPPAEVPAAVKPVLGIEVLSGQPNILWKKGKMDGIKIVVDRGTGTYSFLAFDTYPDYLDTHPLPEFGKAEVWKYIAIYMKRDEPVGEWSDPVQISVTGRPA
jgi:hypothetical protein